MHLLCITHIINGATGGKLIHIKNDGFSLRKRKEKKIYGQDVFLGLLAKAKSSVCSFLSH
jgi:hypothetical protein